MWYWYKQSVEMFGKEKADELFDRAWVSKWRQKMSEEEKKEKEYIKLTESAHSKIIHKYLDDLWYKHNHSPNEAGLSWSKYVIIAQAKKKAEWTSAWYPDFHILLPFKYWYINLYIELKKAPWKQWWWNWSTFKIDQANWLNELDKVPFNFVSLCQWSEQAMNLIEDMIEKLKDKTINEVLELWRDRDIVDYTTRING